MRIPSLNKAELEITSPQVEVTKICYRCKKEKPICKFRYAIRERSTCEDCYKEMKNDGRVNYRLNNPENHLLRNAYKRSKKYKREFNLELSDIVIPKYCPILGIRIRLRRDPKNIYNYNSPTLDRIDSTKGYTKGNVIVCSWRANVLKNNGTLKEFRLIYKFLKQHAQRA